MENLEDFSQCRKINYLKLLITYKLLIRKMKSIAKILCFKFIKVISISCIYNLVSIITQISSQKITDY